MKKIWPIASLLCAAPLMGCAAPQNPVSAAANTRIEAAQDQFMAALAARCGQAFAGKLVSDPAKDADMAGKPMVMHIRHCSADRIEIPFHIGGMDSGDGWDRSRTWIITRTAAGLRLKHDHRHADGSADALTFYGGDTDSHGTAQQQNFPVDAESIAMFNQAGLTASTRNIWHVSINEQAFTYGLSREGRDFRVSFDLSKPVPAPSAPWGW